MEIIGARAFKNLLHFAFRVSKTELLLLLLFFRGYFIDRMAHNKLPSRTPATRTFDQKHMKSSICFRGQGALHWLRGGRLSSLNFTYDTSVRTLSDISQFDRVFRMKPILTEEDIADEDDEEDSMEGIML